MRRPLTFACQGATLAGVLHPATGTTGVVIVSGGVQTRAGSHRGFVDLADRFAAAGHPTLRFDRRGVGDSDGDDRSFRDSADDIASAIAEIRAQVPELKQVIGWGLCDGASALTLNAATLGLDGLILANPWTRDADAPTDVPPRAAVAARYRQRLTSPREWVRLTRRGFDVRKAARGLLRMALPEAVPLTARSMAASLQSFTGPSILLLSGRDATAQAFEALWRSATFRLPKARKDIEVTILPDATHTFARAEDAAAMAKVSIDWISGKEW